MFGLDLGKTFFQHARACFRRRQFSGSISGGNFGRATTFVPGRCLGCSLRSLGCQGLFQLSDLLFNPGKRQILGLGTRLCGLGSGRYLQLSGGVQLGKKFFLVLARGPCLCQSVTFLLRQFLLRSAIGILGVTGRPNGHQSVLFRLHGNLRLCSKIGACPLFTFGRLSGVSLGDSCPSGQILAGFLLSRHGLARLVLGGPGTNGQCLTFGLDLGKTLLQRDGTCLRCRQFRCSASGGNLGCATIVVPGRCLGGSRRSLGRKGCFKFTDFLISLGKRQVLGFGPSLSRLASGSSLLFPGRGQLGKKLFLALARAASLFQSDPFLFRKFALRSAIGLLSLSRHTYGRQSVLLRPDRSLTLCLQCLKLALAGGGPFGGNPGSLVSLQPHLFGSPGVGVGTASCFGSIALGLSLKPCCLQAQALGLDAAGILSNLQCLIALPRFAQLAQQFLFVLQFLSNGRNLSC